MLLGFAFRRAAAVGKEDAQLQATPQMIGVFSTDPNATIHLTTRVFWRNVNGFAERLPFEIRLRFSDSPQAREFDSNFDNVQSTSMA